MDLYEIAIPQLLRTLRQVPLWLDKAQAHAEQRKFDPEVLLEARLAPDQWPLSQQLSVVALAPQRLAALLRGMEPPGFPAGPVTLPALRERIDAAITHLAELAPEDFKGCEERVIPLPFLPGKGMKAADLVVQFSLPNFTFHAVTAYSILRHNGVDVGKQDFLGELSIRDL